MLTLMSGLVSLPYSYLLVCMCLTGRLLLCVGKIPPVLLSLTQMVLAGRGSI